MIYSAALCLKVKSHYLAIASLAYGQVLMLLIARPLSPITNGPNGLWGIPSLFAVERFPYFYAVLALALGAIYLKYKIINSRYGLYLRAIGQNPEAAQALGLHVNKYRTLILMLSSMLSGIFASYYAYYVLLLAPEFLDVGNTFQILVYTLIGGASTISGPLIGSILMVALSEGLRFLGLLRYLIYGLLVVVIITFWRGGIASIIQRLLKVRL